MSKEELIKQICKLQPSYTFGDNAEQLWNQDEEELLEEYKTLQVKGDTDILTKKEEDK